MKKRPAILLLHLSLIVILAGALLLWGENGEGTVHLRTGEKPVTSIVNATGETEELPFAVSLERFTIETYPGTGTPRDFVSRVALSNGEVLELSMNHVARAAGYKFMQQKFDSDGLGVTLSLSALSVGTTVVYIGFALLCLAMVWFFFERATGFRAALRHLKTTVMVVFALLIFSAGSSASEIDRETESALMRLMVMNNDRVTPVATLVSDFTSTISGGSTSAGGRSAADIFCGYLFDFGEYRRERLLKVKNKELRGILGIDGKYASWQDWVDAGNSGRLDLESPEIAERYAADISRFEAVNMLVSGELLKLFPVPANSGPDKIEGRVDWYSPVSVPGDIDGEMWVFIRKSLGYLNERVATGDSEGARQLLEGLYKWQCRQSGLEVPKWRVSLEEIYSRWGRATGLMILVFAGSLAILVLAKKPRARHWVAVCISVVAFACLTALIAARWVIGGYVPLSNGFETMQFMGWCLLVVSLFCLRRGREGYCAAALFSAALCLSVAAMSGAGRSIGTLLPVLASPLMSIHVMLVMSAYALFLLIAVSSATGLFSRNAARLERHYWLGRAMLYPAVFLLCGGIIVGSIWADVSWGRLWSWDPKETWALITMIVYCVPLHSAGIGIMRKRRVFLGYTLVAFLSVLMTYFGVNFFLGGLHSYA